jgi:hypothetical protein
MYLHKLNREISYQSCQIGNGRKSLGYNMSKIDRAQDEKTGGLYTKMRIFALEGEWNEAQNGDQKYKHVGIVNVVARSSGYIAGYRETRPLVVLPYIINV